MPWHSTQFMSHLSIPASHVKFLSNFVWAYMYKDLVTKHKCQHYWSHHISLSTLKCIFFILLMKCIPCHDKNKYSLASTHIPYNSSLSKSASHSRSRRYFTVYLNNSNTDRVPHTAHFIPQHVSYSIFKITQLFKLSINQIMQLSAHDCTFNVEDSVSHLWILKPKLHPVCELHLC